MASWGTEPIETAGTRSVVPSRGGRDVPCTAVKNGVAVIVLMKRLQEVRWLVEVRLSRNACQDLPRVQRTVACGGGFSQNVTPT